MISKLTQRYNPPLHSTIVSMTESMVSITLSSRGKKIPGLPSTVSTFKGAPTSELTSIIAKKTGLNQNRFKLTDDKGKAVSTIEDDTHISVKDLGPQISWRGVFVCEYAGPLLLHPLVFSFFSNRSSGQWITMIMVVLHFIKREYETLYVHRFSSDTMPVANLFKNCAYYWFIGGAGLAAVTYSDYYKSESYAFPKIAVFLYVFAELSNYRTHVMLRDLRPAGTRERNIPRGFGFDLVSCPNYSFEILAWCAISSVTGSLASWAFTIIGGVQMYFWAIKKHQRYKKEFKDYPRGRKMLIPFVL